MSVLGVAKKMLEILGFTVYKAANGLEALEQLRKKSTAFCAVILDISMPEMGSVEAMN